MAPSIAEASSDDAYDDSTTVYAPPAQVRAAGSADTVHPPTVIVKEDSRPNIRSLPTTPAGLKIPEAVLKKIAKPTPEPTAPDSTAAVERPAETTQPRKVASVAPPPDAAKPAPPKDLEKVNSKRRVPVYVAAIVLAAASFALTFALSRSTPTQDAVVEDPAPEPPEPRVVAAPEPPAPEPVETVEPASLPVATDETAEEKKAAAEPVEPKASEPVADPADDPPAPAPKKRSKPRRVWVAPATAAPVAATAAPAPALAPPPQQLSVPKPFPVAPPPQTPATSKPPSPSPPPLDDLLDNPYASMKAAPRATTPTSPAGK
jgi:hypothetical protein